MHPPRLTIGSLLFVISAFGIGLAALKENDLQGIGLSMLMIIGLLGAAFGAASDAGAVAPEGEGGGAWAEEIDAEVILPTRQF